MEYDREYLDMLQWRDIDPEHRGDIVCVGCGGSGIKVYGESLSGYMDRTSTTGVCDECWGSGKSNTLWANLRELYAMVHNSL